MTPRPSYHFLRAAWIMARAFTPHPALALLAYPWTLISITPGTLRGGLYLDPTRTGMVMLYRSMMLLDVLIAVPVVVVFFIAVGTAASALSTLLPGGVAALFVFVLAVAGLLFLLPRGGGSLFPWGPETPKGQRWEIAGLAQMPGTRLTAIQLALRVLDEVPPPGAVIIATANSADLYRQYRSFGFTGGPKHRVHKVVG